MFNGGLQIERTHQAGQGVGMQPEDCGCARMTSAVLIGFQDQLPAAFVNLPVIAGNQIVRHIP
jgi:hypothetical protein